MSGSFNPHNSPVRWYLLSLPHIRGNQDLAKLSWFPKEEPGLTIYSGVFQTPKPKLLPCIAILPKPTVIPVALASASKACHGGGVDGELARANPLPFSTSVLTPHWDWDCEAWSCGSGEGLPTLSLLQLSELGCMCTLFQWHWSLTSPPPIMRRVMPEFLFSFQGNPIQMSGQGSSDAYFEL